MYWQNLPESKYIKKPALKAGFFIEGRLKLNQNLAFTIGTHTADNAVFFHLVNDSCSTVIAQTEFTLQG
jgi:hypothetical protein